MPNVFSGGRDKYLLFLEVGGGEHPIVSVKGTFLTITVCPS